MDNTRRTIKPDAQPFDRIELVTIPRWKTSGLSGDEWRISVEARFYRNGKLVHQTSCGSNMDYAVQLLNFEYLRACDNGLGFYAGEGDYCDQEGCSEEAIVIYRKKFDYCREGHKTEISVGPKIRKFCGEHRERGDCGLDDANRNYEIEKGE